MTGEEVTSLQMSVYAQQFGALQVALEHRFYGESKPFPTSATGNLRYLTVEQALADAASFIAWFKEQYPGAGPLVSFGGSYCGTMAAWFRVKYPTISDGGAVASSAPLRAEPDFCAYK